jgi:hypothetical protein
MPKSLRALNPALDFHLIISVSLTTFRSNCKSLHLVTPRAHVNTSISYPARALTPSDTASHWHTDTFSWTVVQSVLCTLLNVTTRLYGDSRNLMASQLVHAYSKLSCHETLMEKHLQGELCLSDPGKSMQMYFSICLRSCNRPKSMWRRRRVHDT